MGIEFVRDERDKQFDALALKDADPNKRYRFVRKKDINIAKAKFNGYDMVDSSSDKVRSVLDDSTQVKKGSDVTTAIEVGDMVLMSQPMEKHEERMKRRNAKIQREEKSSGHDAVNEMNRQGGGQIRAFEDNSESRGMKSVEESDVMAAIERDRRKGK